MTDRTFIIISFLFCLTTKAQNPVDILMKDDPDGEHIVKWENGNIREHFFKKNGHVTGTGKEYYPTGQLKNLYYMNNGVYVDTSKCFYEDGQIRSIDVYKNDTLLYSELRFYYRNGNLQWVNKYYLDGLNISYTNIKTRFRKLITKTVVTIDRFKLSEIEGSVYIEEWFYDNKSIYYKYSRLSNKKDGPQYLYHDNGKIKVLENYTKGLKNGSTEYYDKNGTLKKKKCFKDDKKIECK